MRSTNGRRERTRQSSPITVTITITVETPADRDDGSRRAGAALNRIETVATLADLGPPDPDDRTRAIIEEIATDLKHLSSARVAAVARLLTSPEVPGG